MTQLNLRLKREQPFRESLKRACFKAIKGLGLHAPNPNEERLRVKCGARLHFIELLKHTRTESKLLADRLKLKAFEFAEVPMQPRASLSKDAKEKFAQRSARPSFEGTSSCGFSVFETQTQNFPNESSTESSFSRTSESWRAIEALFRSGPKEPGSFKILQDFCRREKRRSSSTTPSYTDPEWMNKKRALKHFTQTYGLRKDDKVAKLDLLLESFNRQKNDIAGNRKLAMVMDRTLHQIYARIDDFNVNHKDAILAISLHHSRLQAAMVELMNELEELLIEFDAFRDRIKRRLERKESFPGAEELVGLLLNRFSTISSKIYDLNNEAATNHKRVLRALPYLNKAHSKLVRFCSGFNEYQRTFSKMYGYNSPNHGKFRHPYHYQTYRKALEDHGAYYSKVKLHSEHLVDSLSQEMLGLYNQVAEA